MRYRKILHIDLDAFFCSVEEIIDPSLIGVAFATGGSPDGRGVVTSCSYAARKFGIHSAMPMKTAIQKAPSLRVVRGHYKEYSKYSRKVMEILEDTTPLVEQISIDEAFIDVTDMPTFGREIAQTLQTRILKKTGLPCSIGIASNKLVAKIATNIAKASYRGDRSPQAILVVEAGKEAEFLAPLAVKELWGIGKKGAQRFNQLGYQTIGDIGKADERVFQEQVGNFARTLQRRAKGIDDRDVGGGEGVKSVSNEMTFGKDLTREEDVYRVLHHLSAKVAFRLRKKNLCGSTIRLKIRWPNFETHTRQLSLKQATNHDTVIYDSVYKLLKQIWKPGKRIRLLGVGAANLQTSMRQLSIFDADHEKEKQLLEAIDTIKDRYGKNAIKHGWSVLRERDRRSRSASDKPE